MGVAEGVRAAGAALGVGGLFWGAVGGSWLGVPVPCRLVSRFWGGGLHPSGGQEAFLGGVRPPRGGRSAPPIPPRAAFPEMAAEAGARVGPGWVWVQPPNLADPENEGAAGAASPPAPPGDTGTPPWCCQ